ncbi:MAG: formate/nitrite transporter family protein [Ornithinimicrobium sp.]
MATSKKLGDDEVEEEVEGTFDHSVGEGQERLHRSLRVMLTTGFLGGIEIGFGVLAYLSVYDATGNPFLGSIAFSIGFAALYLAHSELFTEGFFYPIVAIFAGQGSVLQLARLWGLTLLANLAGGWVLMWLVVWGFPKLHPTIATKSLEFVEAPLGVESIALALLGGGAITLMTRMKAGSTSQVATLAASLAGAFLLIGLGLFHSILDSIIIFGALHSGAEGVTYGNWLAWFWYVTLANVIGGLALVTAPRLVRSSALVTGGSDSSRGSRAR